MSFARAFSKRRTQRDITPPSSPLKRASTVSKHQISAPVELISTTNMLSYTAPSLRMSTSKNSFDSNISSPPPLTPDLGALTPPSTPPAAEAPIANQQTYFIPRSNSLPSTTSSMKEAAMASSIAPPLPTLSVRRSNTLSASPIPAPPPKSLSRTMSVSSVNSTTSLSRQSSQRPSKNPFGPELAQVSELAEEMGLDLEEEYMSQHGLVKFNVDDYLSEVESISWGPQSAQWI